MQKKRNNGRLLKIPDNKIQQEWCRTIEKTLYQFTNCNALRTIAGFIANDYYGNMSPFLVNEILRMGAPACGIQLALYVMVETMKDVCNEAAHEILRQCNKSENVPKTPTSITLLCETLAMPTISWGDILASEDLEKSTPLQVKHILKNDRQREWLKQYKEAQKSTINVFTVRLGPGNIKATPTTGLYIMSLLMPLYTPLYRFEPRHDPHSTTYEELQQDHKNALIELTAHRRMAENTSKGKLTPYEEVKVAAQQLQHKELQNLRNRTHDQEKMIATLNRQIHDLKTILREREMKQIDSLEETIVLMRHKLSQSRAKIVGLRNHSTLKRDREESGLTPENDAAANDVSKKQRVLNGYIKNNSPTITSDSDDDEDYNQCASISYDDDGEEDEEDEES